MVPTEHSIGYGIIGTLGATPFGTGRISGRSQRDGPLHAGLYILTGQGELEDRMLAIDMRGAPETVGIKIQRAK
jgi:hypothetical protein